MWEGVPKTLHTFAVASSLSRGTYADEMFMYEPSQAEFEVTLCDLGWSNLFDAAMS